MKRGRMILAAATLGLCLAGCSQEKQETGERSYEFTEVSVHDPSVVRQEGVYYIFGSHLAAAKSGDLMNWESIGNGVTADNPIIKNAPEMMKESFEWSKTKTFWAPDVIQLRADQRFYMYYCTCEGSKPLSTLGIAVSDEIEGPYEDLGIILKSGMTKEASENGDAYNAAFHPNVVDPCVFYDEEGKLWMMYGSYSGGIYILELNQETGFPLEEGYGKKILGANHLRIEAPYVLYNKDTGYYYLFLSFGGLDSDGGYHIRVCRSKNPDGPYYDPMEQDMLKCKGNKVFDDETASRYGLKMNGNYKWESPTYLSPGHNSAVFDEESGKYFIIFHTRFEDKGEQHEVRTHQMFFNEDGWPVMVPYRYTGENLKSGRKAYGKKDVAGSYGLINHGREITTDIAEPENIVLTKSGKIEGAVSGSYHLNGNSEIEMVMDEMVYKGIVIEAYDEDAQKMVMTFTVAGENGITLWGSASEKKK